MRSQLSYLSLLITHSPSRRSRDTSQATTAVSAISLHTIRLLGVILSDYVTRVVHRAIVLGEQEILFKGGRKVWRHENDDVSLRMS